jgi:hypothetical protein
VRIFDLELATPRSTATEVAAYPGHAEFVRPK